MIRRVTNMLLLTVMLCGVGCGGPVCEPGAESALTPVTPSSVSTSPDLDEDFACVARMTHGSGEAGATFGFSRHTDGTPSSRSSSLALGDASCTFEARYAPGFVVGTADEGMLTTAASCRRGDETESETTRDGEPIAFLLGGDVAVRFECRSRPSPHACGGWDCDDIVVTPGK